MDKNRMKMVKQHAVCFTVMNCDKSPTSLIEIRNVKQPKLQFNVNDVGLAGNLYHSSMQI